MMNAETLMLRPAIDAVSEYMARRESDLSSDQLQMLSECKRRLDRLTSLADELIQLNNRLLSKQVVQFDPASESFVMGGVPLFKVNRADPNVPIRVNATGSTYEAGKSPVLDEEEEALRIELEEKLESFYQSAFRIVQLFKRVRIPELSKIKSRCLTVTLVRNKLIEHPNEGGLYSFGVGSTGPRVKPMYQQIKPEFNDEGLVPNTREFVDAIVSGCRS